MAVKASGSISLARVNDGPKGDSTGIISAASAPTTDLYVGKLYLNTTNGITYRYTGSKWEIWSIKAAMMDVDKLSAIIANLGDITAGSFTLPFVYTESGITFTGTLSIKDGSLFIKRTASTGAYWETSIDYRTGVTDTYYPTNKNTTSDVKLAALRAGKMLLMDSGVGGYLPAEALQTVNWVNLPLASGFESKEGATVQYRKIRNIDGSYRVEIRGRCGPTGTGTFVAGTGTPIGTLPVGNRSDRVSMFACPFSGGYVGRVQIEPTGLLNAQVNQSGRGTVMLDGIVLPL